MGNSKKRPRDIILSKTDYVSIQMKDNICLVRSYNKLFKDIKKVFISLNEYGITIIEEGMDSTKRSLHVTSSNNRYAMSFIPKEPLYIVEGFFELEKDDDDSLFIDFDSKIIIEEKDEEKIVK